MIHAYHPSPSISAAPQGICRHALRGIVGRSESASKKAGGMVSRP
jgi:hypothetical protein